MQFATALTDKTSRSITYFKRIFMAKSALIGSWVGTPYHPRQIRFALRFNF